MIIIIYVLCIFDFLKLSLLNYFQEAEICMETLNCTTFSNLNY